MKDQIERFRAWALQDRALSTVQGYTLVMRELVAFRPKARPEDYTPEDLLEFVAEARDRNLKPATISIRVNVLRAFFRFALGELGPARVLKLPKVFDEPQRTLTDAEADALLAAIDTSKVIGKRNLAMLSLMLDTGLRAAEVCALTLESLNLSERSFSVRIKGGRTGQGVFSEYTRAAVGEWLNVRNPAAGVRELFVSVQCGRGAKTSRPGVPLTRQAVRCVMREICKTAGIKHASPHALRRTFATLAIRNGAPTRVVQVAGRWRSLIMVERYTRAIEASDFEKYFPMNRLMSTGPEVEQPARKESKE